MKKTTQKCRSVDQDFLLNTGKVMLIFGARHVMRKAVND